MSILLIVAITLLKYLVVIHQVVWDIKLFCGGKELETKVKSDITSVELFQWIKKRSGGFGDATKLEQWSDVYEFWETVNSAKDIKPADGAKFRVVRMCTVSL